MLVLKALVTDGVNYTIQPGSFPVSGLRCGPVQLALGVKAELRQGIALAIHNPAKRFGGVGHGLCLEAVGLSHTGYGSTASADGSGIDTRKVELVVSGASDGVVITCVGVAHHSCRGIIPQYASQFLVGRW